MTKEKTRAEKIDELLQAVESQIDFGEGSIQCNVLNVCNRLLNIAEIRHTEAEAASLEAQAFLNETQARALAKEKGLDIQYSSAAAGSETPGSDIADGTKTEAELREDFTCAAAGVYSDVDPRSVIAAAISQLKMMPITHQEKVTMNLPPDCITVRRSDIDVVKNLLTRLLEAYGGEMDPDEENDGAPDGTGPDDTRR